MLRVGEGRGPGRKGTAILASFPLSPPSSLSSLPCLPSFRLAFSFHFSNLYLLVCYFLSLFYSFFPFCLSFCTCFVFLMYFLFFSRFQCPFLLLPPLSLPSPFFLFSLHLSSPYLSSIPYSISHPLSFPPLIFLCFPSIPLLTFHPFPFSSSNYSSLNLCPPFLHTCLYLPPSPHSSSLLSSIHYPLPFLSSSSLHSSLIFPPSLNLPSILPSISILIFRPSLPSRPLPSCLPLVIAL